jgi:hypothetical protein
MKKEQSVRRFPRLRKDIWQGMPRLELSKIKDPAWIIKFFLARASTQLIYGAYGTWKTTTMLVAGWCVSQGIPFLGMETKKRCVLYLDYENPDHVVKRMCEDSKIDPTSPNFSIWNRADKPTPLPKDKCLEKFVHRCKKVTGHSPWIIFDSWTSLLKAGESGNQIGEATHIFRAIRHLCDIGATCTIIDHTGHAGDHPIGTSAKMTQMDTSHHFRQQSEEMLQGSNSKRTVVRVESFLKRYAPKDVGTFSLEAHSALDEKGDWWHLNSLLAIKDKAVLKQENEVEGLKRLIKSNPTWGQEDIADAAKKLKIMSRDRARQLLQYGIGKYWETISKAHGKQTFRVLKTKR